MPGGLLDGSVDLAACPDAALVLNAPCMPELKVWVLPEQLHSRWPARWLKCRTRLQPSMGSC